MRARLSRLIVTVVLLALVAATPAATKKKNQVKRIKAKATVTTATAPPVTPRPDFDYSQRPDVLAFIDRMVEKHGFAADELKALFAKTRYLERVVRLMTPATTSAPKSWVAYRARFVEPRRIAAGVRFHEEYDSTLQRAEQQYGVPAHIILGIIGVETIYGRNVGNFRVIDSLTTLSFDYPKNARDRSPFFIGQLEDFLLFARQGKLDLFEVVGSYAGAIGIPQFMPGSYRRFAVDFDGDALIDLRTNPADAIGSVANYLREHGWKPGVTPYFRTALPATLPADEVQRLVDAGSEPRFRADTLRQLGFSFDPGVADDMLLSLIDLPNETRAGEPAVPHEYVLGSQNFDALTRYNRSYFYAVSVVDLGEAVLAAQPNR